MDAWCVSCCEHCLCACVIVCPVIISVENGEVQTINDQVCLHEVLICGDVFISEHEDSHLHVTVIRISLTGLKLHPVEKMCI